jgi:protein-S-isoprenylcysteine O-methyltransferase Ste14
MATMRKLLAVIFGVAVYGFFGLTWGYFIGFLGGWPVPKGIDAGAVGPVPLAIAIDLGCLAVFFAHHSVMARARAKLAIARVVPPAIERSTYVLVAGLALVFMMVMWRPLPQVVWQAGGAVRAATLMVFWTGVVVTLAGSHMLDALALFGVRQVVAHFRGRTLPATPFRTPGLYRLVRHPMMTGMLMTFWAAPTMTQGRLLLALAMTGYILAAVKWLEERDLRKAFGTQYESYARQVPMLLPLRLRPDARKPAERRRSCSGSMTDPARGTCSR